MYQALQQITEECQYSGLIEVHKAVFTLLLQLHRSKYVLQEIAIEGSTKDKLGKVQVQEGGWGKVPVAEAVLCERCNDGGGIIVGALLLGALLLGAKRFHLCTVHPFCHHFNDSYNLDDDSGVARLFASAAQVDISGVEGRRTETGFGGTMRAGGAVGELGLAFGGPYVNLNKDPGCDTDMDQEEQASAAGTATESKGMEGGHGRHRTDL
ncbi:hypothetical protein BDZ91DRAFT_785246 [Kalaharituber pfeilii]|nr:hypothetical protein BDZ91DRAFT_785246 [Kalaharituber pfeilii]